MAARSNTGGRAKSTHGACDPGRPAYLHRMGTLLLILLGLVMMGVLGVLATGIVGVVRGGGDPRRSNRLMQWRVALQAVAVALFVAVLLLLKR
jgi:hypothetical protein